jgi:hypothetical protein
MSYPPDLAPRVSYPTFGTRAGLGGLSVAGVEEEERKRKKKEKKREGVVGLRPYLDLLAPSAVDPRVSAHTGEGLGRRLGLALSAAAHRSLGVAAAAREKERRKREMRLGFARWSRSAILFGREPRAAIGLR